MSQWLKAITGCLCILTILMHLVPKGKFSVYVRFYGGLLFFLVAAGPLWKLLAGEGELERLLQLEFLRSDSYDLESSVSGMAELKNDRIREAYRDEIVRQIREIASAYGVEAKNIQLTFGEDGYRITGISMDAAAGSDEGTTGAKAAQMEALEGVKRECAGVYALGLDQIYIRTGESRQWENGWTR